MRDQLPVSYKQTYPFRIGTTSFIYPAGWFENAAMLAPFLDEIELIFFESHPNALPPLSEIEQLRRLGKEQQIAYNVHLPIDTCIGSLNLKTRKNAREAILRIVEMTEPLAPSTYTLHVIQGKSEQDGLPSPQWEKSIRDDLSILLDQGISPHHLTLENLDYPFHYLDAIIHDFELHVCIDVGHCLLGNETLGELFKRYGNITDMIHLYGIETSGRHRALNRLGGDVQRSVVDFLKSYTGTVSIEVFSYTDLAHSLETLQKVWTPLA